MPVKGVYLLLVTLAALVDLPVRAEDTRIALQRSGSLISLDLPREDEHQFWDRFETAFDQRAEDVFSDRFHPFSVLEWSPGLREADAAATRDRAASMARNALLKSFKYSVREATVELSVMSWLEERQGFFAGLLRNSVGSVAEESVSPRDPSYRLAERSWWSKLSENHELRYGVRPLRTDPYAYLSLGLKDGDTLLLLSHVRYHYLDFADHQFELALSVPLPQRFSIDLGTTYQFGRHGQEEGLVLKLFKEFKRGGIMHIGLEAGQQPTALLGMAFPW